MPEIRRFRAPLRAPLAFLLLPLIAGHGLAAWARPHPALLLTLSALISLASLCALQRNRAEAFWTPLFLLAAVLSFWADGLIRGLSPPVEGPQEQPRRESRLVLQVERTFASSPGSDATSGIARVVRSKPHDRIPPGSRVCFRAQGRDPCSSLRGHTILVEGLLQVIPGGTPKKAAYGFHDFLCSSGVFHLLERGQIIQTISPAPPWLRFFASLEKRFVQILHLGEPEDPGPGRVYRAMLLGKKGALDDRRRADYRDTGTLHLFAISGLHIAVVAAVLHLLLQVVRLPAQLRPLLALPILYAYVQSVGAPPSAVRAFLMAAFLWLSAHLRRQRSPVAALAGSATFVLLLQPAQLGNPGFQLSYAVVLGILLFGLPLHAAVAHRLSPFAEVPKRELRRGEKRLMHFADSTSLLLCVGLSAWLSSAPLCAAFFGVIAPAGILLNLALVHLASLVIVTGIVSLLLGITGFDPASAFVNQAAWIVIGLMDVLVRTTAAIPGSSIPCTLSRGWAFVALASFFGMLIVAHSRKSQATSGWLVAAPVALLLLLALGLACS